VSKLNIATEVWLEKSVIGDFYEQLATEFFEAHGFVVKKLDESIPENRGRFDLYVSNDQCSFTIEVKGDERSATSGNYAIERIANGRPTGISISEADYWLIYSDKDTVVMIKKDVLSVIPPDAGGRDRWLSNTPQDTRGDLIKVEKVRASGHMLHKNIYPYFLL
jgi:Holliday junction resolvase-like predicted endonuclease